MAKQMLRQFIDKGARLKQYFLRGHSQWFALLFSLIMFTLIVNNLLIKNLHFVPDELKSYTVFVTIFAIIYFPVATILGYLDFRKGTFAAEQILHQQMSPIWRDVFARLEKLEEGNEEVLAKLEKLS
ncbi:MAG: hypothetical protein ACXACI_13535 [Candidatus Hodarchaeales archaeon]|jgi:hypothetical protein